MNNVGGSRRLEGGRVEVAGGAASAGPVYLLLESRLAIPEQMCSRSEEEGFNELVA